MRFSYKTVEAGGLIDLLHRADGHLWEIKVEISHQRYEWYPLLSARWDENEIAATTRFRQPRVGEPESDGTATDRFRPAQQVRARKQRTKQ